MYVIKRTVGTSIKIGVNGSRIDLTLVGIDWLGGCALVKVQREGENSKEIELGAGETMDLTEDIHMHMLRLARASHQGIPSQVVEFGFEAPVSIPIKRAEEV